jgi:hypothetical protein
MLQVIDAQIGASAGALETDRITGGLQNLHKKSIRKHLMSPIFSPQIIDYVYKE